MNGKILGVTLALLIAAPALFAQWSTTYNHAEVGAFVNYTLLHDAGNTNFFGVGGRLGINASPHVALEAEGAYDFQRYVNASFNGNFVSVRSGLHMTHFLFGPTFKSGGSGPLRIFVTAKGGLINFSNATCFACQVNNIPFGDTDAVFYPGGGFELFAGWLGMRFEAGDEIYFSNGAHNNLRATIGPVIRF